MPVHRHVVDRHVVLVAGHGKEQIAVLRLLLQPLVGMYVTNLDGHICLLSKGIADVFDATFPVRRLPSESDDFLSRERTREAVPFHEAMLPQPPAASASACRRANLTVFYQKIAGNLLEISSS